MDEKQSQPAPAAPVKRKKPPVFTDEELQVIHRDLYTAGYQPNLGYETRRSVIDKLFAYFEPNRDHLGPKWEPK